MPISYTGINDEHQAVRRNAGVFDVSHMGEFMLKGEHALDLIQRVTTNDASKLTPGKAQYSCLTNQQGGIVDDLIVYCVEENKVYMIVVNASNIEKDWNWISKLNQIEAQGSHIALYSFYFCLVKTNTFAGPSGLLTGSGGDNQGFAAMFKKWFE